jgi:phosphoenolpyruvate-protein kinase (PTS system EI component)
MTAETTTNLPARATLLGQTVSPGMAYGPVYVRDEDFAAAPEHSLRGEEVDTELARLDSAARAARVGLVHQRDNLAGRFHEDQRRIFDAHLKILEDPSVEADIRNRIREGMPLEASVRDVLQVYERLCQVVETEGMRNKLADLRDVAWRLLQHCNRGRAVEAAAAPSRQGSVLVVHELSVSDLTEALERGVAAIIAEAGTMGSHGTILTRAAGMPALIGVDGIREAIREAKMLLVDGESGQVLVDPSPEAVESSLGKVAEQPAAEAIGPALLADGTEVRLSSAVASPAEARRAINSGVSTIGLYRTELPLIQRQGRPREDSLVQFHGKVLRGAESAQVRLPDLDPSTGLTRFFAPGVGDAKLGPRGVRVLLAHPDMLGVQLRALMRAVEGKPLQLAIPAVVDPGDLQRVREAVDNAREELRLEGVDVSSNPKLGAVFETPSSALLGRELMADADFALIGLDAMCEHIVGCDVDSRDPDVRALAMLPHPALLRAIGKLVQLAEGRDRKLTVYGERLAEGVWMPLLIGLGVRRFALRPGILREVHGKLGGLDLELCERIAERAARAKTADEVAAMVPPTWLVG